MSAYDGRHFVILSFDQNRKLQIYVGFGSVFALEKSKIITLYKRSAYCIFFLLSYTHVLHLSGCYFNFCNNECIMTFPHSLVLDSNHQNFQNSVTSFFIN